MSAARLLVPGGSVRFRMTGEEITSLGLPWTEMIAANAPMTPPSRRGRATRVTLRAVRPVPTDEWDALLSQCLEALAEHRNSRR
jgi:hypothetical protein